MKVLVTGGRDYSNWQRVCIVLQALQPSLIIHGGARGADSLAGQWAALNGVPCNVYRADWDKHSRRAGSIRNMEMLDASKPDCVVAFPGGVGTAHMVRYADSKGCRVLTVTT